MTNPKRPEDECETGCMTFTGGEKKHHVDCIYYKGSRTEMFDKVQAQLDEAVIVIKLWKKFSESENEYDQGEEFTEAWYKSDNFLAKIRGEGEK